MNDYIDITLTVNVSEALALDQRMQRVPVDEVLKFVEVSEALTLDQRMQLPIYHLKLRHQIREALAMKQGMQLVNGKETEVEKVKSQRNL